MDKEPTYQYTSEQAQGIALIELVIERVRANPDCLSDSYHRFSLSKPEPLPAGILATLTFPDGRPLSPSLRRWLAFDYTWLARLGWFTSSTQPISFMPRRLDGIVQDELGTWGELYVSPGQRINTCFLLPGGSDSRRVYAVTEPDTLGEYPVLAVDVDDLPYVGLMYPGFDVYMAHVTGVIQREMKSYTFLFQDPRYYVRLQGHAHHLFQGKKEMELGDKDW